MPVIGVSGFAAAATAAGTVGGSVAVAASFGGKCLITFIALRIFFRYAIIFFPCPRTKQMSHVFLHSEYVPNILPLMHYPKNCSALNDHT